ncbi:hypothetical protein BGX24_000115 [Mortierella sp. AD032]|nr:hypothetical protein BGX24_000115 [Mortierella sp. AD032]
METIYGIQADTDTLREAHEHQRRMQQRLQEQQSSVPEPPPAAATKTTGLSNLKSVQSQGGGGAATGLAKPTPIARSTSASALPPSTTKLVVGSTSSVTGYSTPGMAGGGSDTGYSSPYFAGSTATSPFLTAVDHHHHHSSGPAQLRSTTHSPALFSKFYDGEHRLPWLSLPGAVGSPNMGTSSSCGGGGIEGPPSMFGRRRSDVGLPSSGRSTPSGFDLGSSSQQEASFPQPPQPQPQAHSSSSSSHQHHHAQHLLGPQELAALSRHNSPMPLNEALPHYLRKKSNDSLHSMERSFSSPGTNSLHPPPHHTGPSFMLPLGSSSNSSPGNGACVSSHNGGSVGQAAVASPSHLLFPFPGSAATSHPPTTTAMTSNGGGRLEMERASSTGVLPMMNRPSPRPQSQQQPHTTSNSGPGSTSATTGPASFFRTLTPNVHHHHHHHHHGTPSVGLGSITGLDAVAAAAAVASSHSGSPTPSKFGTGGGPSAFFGHHTNSSDRDIPSNKEVHA